MNNKKFLKELGTWLGLIDYDATEVSLEDKKIINKRFSKILSEIGINNCICWSLEHYDSIKHTFTIRCGILCYDLAFIYGDGFEYSNQILFNNKKEKFIKRYDYYKTKKSYVLKLYEEKHENKETGNWITNLYYNYSFLSYVENDKQSFTINIFLPCDRNEIDKYLNESELNKVIEKITFPIDMPVLYKEIEACLNASCYFNDIRLIDEIKENEKVINSLKIERGKVVEIVVTRGEKMIKLSGDNWFYSKKDIDVDSTDNHIGIKINDYERIKFDEFSLSNCVDDAKKDVEEFRGMTLKLIKKYNGK